MKILTIGNAASPHILGRAKAFLRTGISNKILSDQWVKDSEIEVFCPFDDWFEKPIWIRPFYFIKNIIKAINIFRTEYYDMIHIHYAANYIGWIAAFFVKKPIVVIVMGGDVLFEQQNYIPWYQKCLITLALKRADLIIAKSPYIQQRVVTLCNNSKKTISCIFGIEDEFFDSSTHKKNEFSFLSLRPLNSFYNIDKIIDVIGCLNNKGIFATLTILDFFSNISYKRYLEDYISNNPELEGKIIFVPGVSSPRELIPLYKYSDFVIALPSSDGIPQSSLEGMSQKCINILPNHKNYEGIFNEKNSILLSTKTPKEIACEIIEKISFKEEIRLNGERFVRNYAVLNKNVISLRQIFDKILHSNKKNTIFALKLKILFLFIIYFIDQFFILGMRKRFFRK
ncbi:MAG: glycosyltransferase [Candidatus Paracaedibacteraceae bacterium]|nr:glycosyltransferase [Candidatus Paracaedibacteraceae bacterium]